jgi:hypothetical protein
VTAVPERLADAVETTIVTEQFAGHQVRRPAPIPLIQRMNDDAHTFGNPLLGSIESAHTWSECTARYSNARLGAKGHQFDDEQ